RPAVRYEEVVRCRGALAAGGAPGSVHLGAPGAGAVAEPRVHPRLVVRRPVLDAIAEPADDSLHVLAERVDRRANVPAPLVLERLREIPVEERRERLDAVREQLVDEAVVEVEP